MQNSHLKIPLTAHKNCNSDLQAQTNTTVALSPIKIESYKIHVENSEILRINHILQLKILTKNANI